MASEADAAAAAEVAEGSTGVAEVEEESTKRVAAAAQHLLQRPLRPQHPRPLRRQSEVGRPILHAKTHIPRYPAIRTCKCRKQSHYHRGSPFGLLCFDYNLLSVDLAISEQSESLRNLFDALHYVGLQESELVVYNVLRDSLEDALCVLSVVGSGRLKFSAHEFARLVCNVGADHREGDLDVFARHQTCVERQNANDFATFRGFIHQPVRWSALGTGLRLERVQRS